MDRLLKTPGQYRILGILKGKNGESPLELIELAGRTAYQSRDKITPKSAERFVRAIIRAGHLSVIEHSAMTVEFANISRGFTHELVRHRLTSVTQESTRYVDKREMQVISPPEKNDYKEKISLTLPNGQEIKVSLPEWVDLNSQIYKGLRQDNWRQEDARQFLPIGIANQIVLTTNFREWRHIFQLRCAPDAHWEIRLMMIELLKEVQKIIPVVFEDLEINEENHCINKH
jgi:thymidylate synthase (FAD)